MIDDEEHPHYIACMREMDRRINKFYQWPVTELTLNAIQDELARHRITCRRNGVDFPEVVVIGLPRSNTIYVRRRDLNKDGIANLVIHMTKADPPPTAEEIAIAIHRAYPGVKTLL